MEMLEKEKAKYSPKPLPKIDINTVTTVRYGSPLNARSRPSRVVKRKVKPKPRPPKKPKANHQKIREERKLSRREKKRLSHERRLAVWKLKEELSDGFSRAMKKDEE